MDSSPVVLITGCSSGIGAALALEFHARGFKVYASARNLQSLLNLEQGGIRTIALDVTRADSIAAAVECVTQEAGRIDFLINNAGFALFGAVADLEPGDLQRQFETNVIAPIQLARAFLPLMLTRKQGRIVNLGSVSGVMTTPFAGAYCASKAALHALSDALRMELAPFGIDVITIQPGAVVSSIGATGAQNIVLPEKSVFWRFKDSIYRRAMASQKGAMPTGTFAKEVIDAVLAQKAPITVRKGTYSIQLPLLKRCLPARMLDRKLSKMFGLRRDPL